MVLEESSRVAGFATISVWGTCVSRFISWVQKMELRRLKTQRFLILLMETKRIALFFGEICFNGGGWGTLMQ